MSQGLLWNDWARLLGLIAAEIAVLAGLAALLERLVTSAGWRRHLWQMAFVGMTVVSVCEASGLGRALIGWVSLSPVPSLPKQSVHFVILTSMPPDPRIVDLPESLPALAESFPSAATATPKATWWPGLVWAIGLLVFLARLGLIRAVFFWVRRRGRVATDDVLLERVYALAQRLGVRRPVRVTELDGIAAPIAYGVIRPTVSLPPGFAERTGVPQQNVVLAHELAHLGAGDPLWQTLSNLVVALLWWHPAAWWAKRRLRISSEAAADEASLMVENGPQLLAECLIDMGRHLVQPASFNWLGIQGTGFRSALGRRVEHLLRLRGTSWQPASPWRRHMAKAVSFAAILAIIFAGAFVTQRSNAANGSFGEAWRNSILAAALKELVILAGAVPSPTEAAVTSEATNSIAVLDWQPWSPEAVEQARAAGRIVLVDFRADWDTLSQANLKTALEAPAVITKLHELNVVTLVADYTRPSEISETELQRFGRSGIPLTFVYPAHPQAEPIVLPEVLTSEVVLNALAEASKGEPASFSSVQQTQSEPHSNLEYIIQKGDSLYSIVKRFHDQGILVTAQQIREANPGVSWNRLRIGQKLVIPAGAFATNQTDSPTDPNQASALILEGKRLHDAGHLREAEVKWKQALALDPGNKAASYYIDKIQGSRTPETGSRETRSEASPTSKAPFKRDASPAPNIYARTNLAQTGKGRQTIFNKLKAIRLNEVRYDGVSLSEAIKSLHDEVRKRDPDKLGVNFLINSFAEGQDISSAAIRIDPPLKDVTLGQVLDAIQKVSSLPVKYSVEDYAIIFSPKTVMADILHTRWFKIDSDRFRKALNNTKAQPSTPRVADTSSDDVIVQLQSWFQAAGVDLTPPKSVFFNERSGMLMIRATLQELDGVEQFIQVLDTPLPQVVIEIKFVEASQDDKRALGFDWLMGNTANTNSPSSVTGVLTEPQFRLMLRALEQRQGVDVLSTPKITTLSGRQAQIKIVDVRNFVIGLDIDTKRTESSRDTNGLSAIQLITSPFECGPVIDVVPYVSADGYTITMTVVATAREFIGYDSAHGLGVTWTVSNPNGDALTSANPLQFVPVRQYAGVGVERPPSARPPLPVFLLRQVVSSGVVWDGQTLVLAGGTAHYERGGTNKLSPTGTAGSANWAGSKNKIPVLGDLPIAGRLFRSEAASAKKTLLIFVTPTIIDPAGNRIHPPEKLPFTRDAVPPQSLVAPQ